MVNTILVVATLSYILWAMDTRQFWKLIEDARTQIADAADSEAIAARAAVLLSALPREEIVDAQRVLNRSANRLLPEYSLGCRLSDQRRMRRRWLRVLPRLADRAGPRGVRPERG